MADRECGNCGAMYETHCKCETPCAECKSLKEKVEKLKAENRDVRKLRYELERAGRVVVILKQKLDMTESVHEILEKQVKQESK